MANIRSSLMQLGTPLSSLLEVALFSSCLSLLVEVDLKLKMILMLLLLMLLQLE